MPGSPVRGSRKDDQRGGAADSRRGGGGGGTGGSRYYDDRAPPRPSSRGSYPDVRTAAEGSRGGYKDADRHRDDDRYRDGDRDRDVRRDDDYRGRSGSTSGRPHSVRGPTTASRGTPPPAGRDRDGRDRADKDREDARGTPGSGQRSKAPASNSVMAELLKHSKQLAASRGGGGGDSSVVVASARDVSSSPEDGEVRPSTSDPDRDLPLAAALTQQQPVGGKRGRQHVPIVWDPQPSSKKQAIASPVPPVPLGLLERTQHEAMMLRQRMAEDNGIDPDAPAAMKASPSGSSGHGNDEEGEQQEEPAAARGRRGSRAAADSAGEEDEDGDGAGGRQGKSDDGAPRKAGGIKSKWAQLVAEDEEQPTQGSPAMLLGARLTGPAATPTRDEGSGSEGQRDDEDSAGQAPEVPAKLKYDMRRECRSVHEFEKICKISEGTYGVVYKAREKSTGRIVALKRVKMEHETDGFPVTSVREINILLNFHHPNIVNVEEIVVSPTGTDQIYMVMEYMDHDLKSLMDDKSKFSQPFSAGQAKCLMQQLLQGLAFLHENWVLHRDLKTSNILYNGKGDLKLCDFGMARQYGSPLGKYTHTVVTLWYRAPELLFGQEQYSTAVDMWSVGCIMGEILSGKPLLPGQGEFDQIDKMVQLLGTPKVEEWPGLEQLPNFKKINLKKLPSQLRQRFSASAFGGSGTTLTEAGFDLLSLLLTWDPDKRISAVEALEHRWFKEVPLPVSRVLMPTFAPRKAG